MKSKIKRFFQSRYGGDEFSNFLLGISIFLVIIGSIVKSSLLTFIAYIPLIYSITRVLSKNINLRMAENRKFKQAINPVMKKIDILKMKFRDRKKYKYIQCPNCKTYVRLPRKKGRLKIRCTKCGHKFEGRT